MDTNAIAFYSKDFPDVMMESRKNAVYELMLTEKSYIKGLDVVLSSFMNPLLHSLETESPIVSRKDIRILFSDFTSIYSLGKEFLHDMEVRLGKQIEKSTWDPRTDNIGDITVKYFPFMKMYTLYLSNYADSLFHLDMCTKQNNNFFCFIKNAEKMEQCGGLSLKSHLLLPVQRIPRYRLLMKTILENTPKSHTDYNFVLTSFEIIDKVAKLVNDNIKEQEMILKILEIQKSTNINEFLLVPGRRLLKQGYVNRSFKSTLDKKKMYLFNDILMYLSFGKFFGDPENVCLPLEDLEIVPSGKKDQNVVRLLYNGKIITLQLETQKEKREWLDAIDIAINQRKREIRELPPKFSVEKPADPRSSIYGDTSSCFDFTAIKQGM
ncbi:hypothetical protein BB558_004009 [Smittium angustum]|uniref:DH domain-containing protein n=1 Tax=Smittium angustum TaxID=133377 RepID=A0A2U1J4I8_SMIAN|nr:hypothetical protein BB558_004009 [Smittium angustum]